MLFNQTRVHTNWSIHSEIQHRSYDLTPNTEQLLIRFGVNFHAGPSAIYSLGYGRITNYLDNGDFLNPTLSQENRLWEQIILRATYKRIRIENRYRLEQRWIKSDVTTNYKNRIRYLLRVTIPLNNKELMKHTLFSTFYNEVFIHFAPNPFDRNRLYGAMGFQFNSKLSTQIGCLFQTVGAKSKYYLQIGANYNLDFRKTQN